LGLTIFHVRTAEAAAEQKIRAASENIQKIEADDETADETAPTKPDSKGSPKLEK
jgi:hypothetical protein